MLLMTACGAAQETLPNDGPLDGGKYPYLGCLPEHGSSNFTFGTGSLLNRGSATVKVESVSLLHPHNFTLVGSYAASAKDGLIGSWSQWPPPHEFRGVVFPQMQPVDSKHPLEVGPLRSGDPGANVIAHLRRPNTSQLAHVDGLRVTYSVGGRRYITDTAVALGLDKSPSARTC